MASPGLYCGVTEARRLRMRGFPAWLTHRTCHLLKVPAMNLGMGIPLKVATATSNLMIGVTAAASAGVYFERGHINPFIAAPVAAGGWNRISK